MMERMFEKDVIPACGELGVGFVPFSPLGAGFLSGKYSANERYSGDDVRRVITRFAPETYRLINRFWSCCKNLQMRKTLPRRRLLSRGCCISMIISCLSRV